MCNVYTDLDAWARLGLVMVGDAAYLPLNSIFGLTFPLIMGQSTGQLLDVSQSLLNVLQLSLKPAFPGCCNSLGGEWHGAHPYGNLVLSPAGPCKGDAIQTVLHLMSMTISKSC